MKPLYAVLLVFGAALAGGLAFHLTQPQPIKIAIATPLPPPRTAAAPVVKPVVPPAPPPVIARPKPSPMPPAHTFASAPPPIYQEPVIVPRTVPAVRPQSTPRVQTPPVRTATAKPLQWTAVPYQRPAGSAAKPIPPEPKVEAKVEPKVEAKAEPPPAPVAAPVVEAHRPEPRHVTLATGMTIAVRLSEPLSSDRAAAGDHFRGVLLEPLAVEGLVIAERGARVAGRVVETQKQSWAGRKSLLELELSTVSTSDGQEVTVTTDPWILIGGDQPASASTGTVARFRLAGKVVITERQL